MEKSDQRTNVLLAKVEEQHQDRLERDFLKRFELLKQKQLKQWNALSA